MVERRIRDIARHLYRKIPFKMHVYGALRSGPPLPHRLYQHLHFDGPFTVRIDDRHRFRMRSHGAQVENELFWAGFGQSWERMSLRIWAALCRARNGLAIDIGANTGAYALSAAAVGKGLGVIAFEPVARIAKRLADNVSLNDFEIAVEQKAVSDHTGRVLIHDTLVDNNYSASVEGQGTGAQAYEIEACALDDYLASLGNPPVGPIKVDVERHEPAVFQGMRATLETHRPALLVEILDREIGQKVEKTIVGLDYRLFHIDEMRGLIPTDTLGPLPRNNWNHLICSAADFDQAGLQKFVASESRDASTPSRPQSLNVS